MTSGGVITGGAPDLSVGQRGHSSSGSPGSRLSYHPRRMLRTERHGDTLRLLGARTELSSQVFAPGGNGVLSALRNPTG